MIDRKKLAEGSSAYFSEIIREYGRVVKAVCLSFGESEEDADDLVQEVWTLVYVKRCDFLGNGSFAGWLHRITLNHCTDYFRARKAEEKGLENFVERGGTKEIHRRPSNPEEELQRREAERVVWSALDALPEKEGDAIILRHLKGCSPAEVAKEMKIKKASVRSNIGRGMRRLRDIIGGQEK